MIIGLIFCAVSLFSAVRTVFFAHFTAGDKNYAGAVMLYALSAVMAACAVIGFLQI